MKLLFILAILFALSTVYAQHAIFTGVPKNSEEGFTNKSDSIPENDNDSIEEKRIDVFFPGEGTHVIGGTVLNVGWVVNYSSPIDIDNLKLYLTTNNGLTWDELQVVKDYIKSVDRGYSYSFTAPDSFNSPLCRIRIQDETDGNDTIHGESEVFDLKIPASDAYGISFGFNFDFFDGVKVSDIYTSAEIHLPKLLLPIYGVDFILGRGTGHAIVAVGYDDNMKIKNTNPGGIETTGALLIRNSWGTGWGNAGYGWIPYDYVLKGLAVDWWSLLKNEWVNTGEFGL